MKTTQKMTESWSPGDKPQGYDVATKVMKKVGYATSGAIGAVVAGSGAIWLSVLPLAVNDFALSAMGRTPILGENVAATGVMAVFGAVGAAASFPVGKRLILNASRAFLSDDFWRKADGTGLGKAALAISDKFKGWHLAGESLAVTGAVAAGLATAAYAGAGEGGVMMTVGAVGAVAAAGLSAMDRLRAERQVKLAKTNPNIEVPDVTSYPRGPIM